MGEQTQQEPTADQRVINELAIAKAQLEVSLMYANIENQQLKAELRQYRPEEAEPAHA